MAGFVKVGVLVLKRAVPAPRLIPHTYTDPVGAVLIGASEVLEKSNKEPLNVALILLRARAALSGPV